MRKELRSMWKYDTRNRAVYEDESRLSPLFDYTSKSKYTYFDLSIVEHSDHLNSNYWSHFSPVGGFFFMKNYYFGAESLVKSDENFTTRDLFVCHSKMTCHQPCSQRSNQFIFRYVIWTDYVPVFLPPLDVSVINLGNSENRGSTRENFKMRQFVF